MKTAIGYLLVILCTQIFALYPTSKKPWKPIPVSDMIERMHGGEPILKWASDETVEALNASVWSHDFDGYNEPFGIQDGREVIADLYRQNGMTNVSADDVILTLGGSGGLIFAVTALANPGENVLISKPGFPYYQYSIFVPNDIKWKEYSLDMDKGEINLTSVREQIDSRTKAILLCNPHNPTGLIFSKKNLEGLLEIAEEYQIPIISDEVYQKVVYDGNFYPLPLLNSEVPIIVADSLSKRVHVPGWRTGWIVIFNRNGAFDFIKPGLRTLTFPWLGPPAIVQGALHGILKNTPDSYYAKINKKVKTNVDLVMDGLSDVPYVKTYRPHAAMYMLIEITPPGFNDTQLCELSSLYLLPGSFFGAPNHVRMLMARSKEQVYEGVNRLKEFIGNRTQSWKPEPTEPITWISPKKREGHKPFVFVN
ncbi:aminotransferase class I and II domain-containing protein [Ditylenchus destructor]|uniref:Tyrosine aminotransferase n=1 Tax=Ditylenchus destructor TaxID=166010 RepID=A0AAD4R1F9_9BILA|nr:aminotransferase class I and II domain-containing protein [Ditylenchus destructor]